MNTSEIMELLSKLGELLEPTAKQAWDIAYRQSMINGYFMIGFGAFFIVVAVLLLVWSFADKKSDDPDKDGSVQFGLSIFTAGASILLLIFGALIFANPAWATIKLLCKLVT